MHSEGKMCWQMFYASQNKEQFFPYTALTVVSFNGEELSVRQGGDRVLSYTLFVCIQASEN
jgi:hypothetical protein